MTPLEAVAYLQAVLDWSEFCKQHKRFEKAIRTLLRQHEFDLNYIETLKALGGVK